MKKSNIYDDFLTVVAWLFTLFIKKKNRKSLQSPFYFMVVNIVDVNGNGEFLSSQEYLSGSTVSSLYRLRDIDNTGTTQNHYFYTII